MRLGHLGGLVVFVHLRQIVAIRAKLGGSCVPPDGEVLAEGAAQVASVRCGLGHQLVEALRGTGPVGSLHTHEERNRDGDGEAEEPSVRGGAHDGAHE